ncbi:TetR/AcrR family transcriptional regulator [Paraburkholderia sp. BL10I2N1]|uniref:TetR/AcrR family transcriptional regulator n=1 Tax=Paraburkholderia sp. BL10I2N1 TaxID=1938796 RepID=UPI0010F0692C|nr:TetR/AcrR family transcriptional regulator [Paraburkholderia sp. BL10I2N1]TDN57916.1 TetR family transcriptional regulator [Paraburkholderia sp. BL10I2N1]
MSYSLSPFLENTVVYVKREQSDENREALLATASRLFRERGIDGVGVAEIAREAGLTHGALYAHFRSKDDLATEAFSQGLARSREAFRGKAARRKHSVLGYLDYLFSPLRRDDPGMSCPMTASASEIGRHGKDISARFAKGFQDKASAFEAVLDEAIPEAERRRLAMTIVAAEIGAMAAARAVAKSDPSLSDEILKAVRAVLLKASEGQ